MKDFVRLAAGVLMILLCLGTAASLGGPGGLERTLFKDLPNADPVREIVRTVLDSPFYSMRAGFTAKGLTGFNLTDNQVPDRERYNENCLWLGRELHLLPPVTFSRPKGVHDRWCVRDEYGMVDITFTPAFSSTSGGWPFRSSFPRYFCFMRVRRLPTSWFSRRRSNSFLVIRPRR